MEIYVYVESRNYYTYRLSYSRGAVIRKPPSGGRMRQEVALYAAGNIPQGKLLFTEYFVRGEFHVVVVTFYMVYEYF